MQFPTLGPSSLAIMVAQPDKRNANRTASLLEWYDRHIHSKTSPGSNEVVVGRLLNQNHLKVLDFDLYLAFVNGI